jgi:hypothetical protein
VVNLVSPEKSLQRFHGGKRTSSTALAGRLKRQAALAVLWEKKVRSPEEEMEEQEVMDAAMDRLLSADPRTHS